MMTEVTTGLAKSHAIERRAGLHPCALVIGAIMSRIFQVRSLSTMGKSLANGADALEEPSAVPECHGSEAKFRNQQTRISEGCVFHGVFLILRVRSFLGR